MSFVEFLNNANPDPKLLGGKGSNLTQLIKIGIKTPPGFIINTKSYEKFLEESHLREEIYHILTKKYTPNQIVPLSIKLRDLFLKSDIPKILDKEIVSAFNKIKHILGPNSNFSVRSSATIEDDIKFSFAGQAESYLYNKNLKDILHSLKKCWASLFTPQALLYFLQMKKKGYDVALDKLKMAVIVQKMINSEISGVLFTINVLNDRKNEMMINSTWGLGETITTGSIIPDLIIIKKNQFEILKKVIGEKKKKSIANPNGSYTILVNTESNLRAICSLNEKQIYDLYKLGLKLEKEFNQPQDIEWAIEKNLIYILQSRPITTLKSSNN